MGEIFVIFVELCMKYTHLSELKGSNSWKTTYNFRFRVLNATFNNISVISWQSVLLVGKPENPEKTTDLSWATDKFLLYHMLYRVHLTWAGFELTTLVVIGTDWISNYKSNYHTIRTMTAPIILESIWKYANGLLK